MTGIVYPPEAVSCFRDPFIASLSLPAQFLHMFYKEGITRLFFMMRIYKALDRKHHKSYSHFFTSNNSFCNILESSPKPFPEYLWGRELNFTLQNSPIYF